MRSPGSDPNANFTQTTEYRLWLHRDQPVGFAFARIRTTSADEDAIFPDSTMFDGFSRTSPVVIRFAGAR